MANEKNLLGLELNVDQDFIAKAAQNAVIVGISQAIENKDGIIEAVVKTALNAKVDSKGNLTTSDYHSMPILQYLVTQTLVDQTKQILQEQIMAKKGEISEIIKKEISKKGFVNKFIECFFSSVEKCISDYYRTTIDIHFKEWERE